jgi:hypothetical protein
MNIAELIIELKQMANLKEEMLQGIEEAAHIAVDEAATLPGHYQNGWPQLDQSTQDDRSAKGFTANDPLKRTGALAKSMKVEREGDSIHITTDSDGLLAAEWGTTKEPARPVVQTAITRKDKEMTDAAGQFVVAKIAK